MIQIKLPKITLTLQNHILKPKIKGIFYTIIHLVWCCLWFDMDTKGLLKGHYQHWIKLACSLQFLTLPKHNYEINKEKLKGNDRIKEA